MSKRTKAELFEIACKKYLTPIERKELSYEQKVIMINFGAKEELGNIRYDQLKSGRKDVENIGDNDSDIGMLLDDFPLDDIQKQICRYRIQKYPHEEIYALMNIPHTSYYRLLDGIKRIVGDNLELLEPEHDTWNKKVTSYNE